MLERSFEILVRHCAKDVFSPEWELIAQQLSLPSGRIDLLFIDGTMVRHVVELKKGRATLGCLDQVLRYKSDLVEVFGHEQIIPWIVAHEISESLSELAVTRTVRTLELTRDRCTELATLHRIDESVLLGARRSPGILHGGATSGGLWEVIPNRDAFREMPVELAKLMCDMEGWDQVNTISGRMQSAIHYRGVKLGGVNRKHKHSYVSDGVVLDTQFEDQLARLGFRRTPKTQSGSKHEHIYWKCPMGFIDEFREAIQLTRKVVDRALRVAQ